MSNPKIKIKTGYIPDAYSNLTMDNTTYLNPLADGELGYNAWNNGLYIGYGGENHLLSIGNENILRTERQVLYGEATSAKTAAKDAKGQVITDTYETKADAVKRQNSILHEVEENYATGEMFQQMATTYGGIITNMLGDDIGTGNDPDSLAPYSIREIANDAIDQNVAPAFNAIANILATLMGEDADFDADTPEDIIDISIRDIAKDEVDKAYNKAGEDLSAALAETKAYIDEQDTYGIWEYDNLLNPGAWKEGDCGVSRLTNPLNKTIKVGDIVLDKNGYIQKVTAVYDHATKEFDTDEIVKLTTEKQFDDYNANIAAALESSKEYIDEVSAEAIRATNEGSISIGDPSNPMTNQLPISTDANGNVYNNIGYKNGIRWSASGKAESSASDYGMSGFIPCNPGSILNIKNITLATSSSGYLVLFDASKNLLGTQNFSAANITIDGNGNYKITVSTSHSNLAFVRTSFCLFNEKSVILVDQEFSYSETAQRGWLTNENGDYIVPITLSSQIITDNGIPFENYLETELNNIETKASNTYETKTDVNNKLIETKGYIDTKLNSYETTANANAKLKEAKGYSDGNLAKAKTYADGKLTEAQNYTNSAILGHKTYSEFGFKNYQSTYAGAPEDFGALILSAWSNNDRITFTAGNELISFEPYEDTGSWQDEVIITINKEPIVEEAKEYTDEKIANLLENDNLTASRALVSDSSGKIAVSDVTSTELGYLDGVTSSIQTQLNGKASTNAATTSAAGLMSVADKTKLDGIAAGAQVNSITGVKGNAESNYRTGNVNLTSANIGALALTGGTVTGATTFGSTLTVNGATTFSDTTASSSTTTGAVKISGGLGVGGSVYADKVYNAVWNDYAELFPRGEETDPGDIIALDETAEEEKYIKAIKGHKALVGVHSDEYGHLIGGENCSIEENLQKYIPVGLAGRVWVKVHDEPSLGDYITTSEIPGVGEKTNNRNQAIGIVVSKKQNGKVKIKII